MIYPISKFEAGTIYHEVRAAGLDDENWKQMGCGLAFGMGSQLRHPAFTMQPPEESEQTSPIDVSNELLAEAQMSLFREATRLSLLNSYAAAELLANSVYTQTMVANLISKSVPKEFAEQWVEEKRKKNRTDAKFLFHQGLVEACGRSYENDKRDSYYKLLGIQELRHKVAHTGYRPTTAEAKDAHKIFVDAVQWLCAVAGMPVKPLFPAPADTYPGITDELRDKLAINPLEQELLIHLLSATQESDPPKPPRADQQRAGAKEDNPGE